MLYLAHPLMMRREVRQWELEFEEKYGIDLLNPFYDGDAVEGNALDEGYDPNIDPDPKTGGDIVHRDLDLIRGCQGLLAFIESEKHSVGTAMEIFFNSYILDRPTYVISKTVTHHPWIRGLVSKRFIGTKDFERYIDNYGGKNGEIRQNNS